MKLRLLVCVGAIAIALSACGSSGPTVHIRLGRCGVNQGPALIKKYGSRLDAACRHRIAEQFAYLHAFNTCIDRGFGKPFDRCMKHLGQPTTPPP